MFLQNRVSRLLAQLRAAGSCSAPRAPGPAPRRVPRGPAVVRAVPGVPERAPPARADLSGSWGLGAAAVGRRAGCAPGPLAMAAKVDLSTSTDWKEANVSVTLLKGLRTSNGGTLLLRDFVRLKKIPTWKETAKGVTVKVEEPKYKKDKQLNEKISLFRGDITKLEVDAIVNAVSGAFGPVDGCIHRAAGPLLTDECRTLQNCETGKAKITCGYRLPAKYVIHTVGPIAHGEPSASQAAELRSCYLSSLDLLLEHRLRSAAFPCISTGVFGYPNEAAAEVVLTALREWLEQHKDKVRPGSSRREWTEVGGGRM
uniref:Mono-ADP ribosylhydrolase 1 n=1 Tax=Bos mutus grunniens TaxID=30521 RepID=A0A8B9X5U3_BOSMU